MSQRRLLSDAEFHETFAEPMSNVTGSAEALVNIWPYVDDVLEKEFAGHLTAEWDVSCVYESGDRKYQHILVGTDTKNVYLAIVVDVVKRSVLGHHLLNLNVKYSITQCLLTC